MATAQKRGFHFPWGGDAQRDESSGNGSPDGEDLAARLKAATEDLGTGPFPVSAPEAALEEPSATEARDRAAAEEAEEAPGSAGDAMDTVAVEARSAEAPEDQRAETTQPATSASTIQPWPEADHGGGRTAGDVGMPHAGVQAGVVTRSAAAPRRDNPLVAGLVRAMREAAKTARDETVAGLREEAESRAEAIRAQSAVTVTELKKTAEADIAAVKEWSRAELARVREETDARIAARRTQLVTETEGAGQATEHLLASLQATVGAFESDMAAFFDTLLAEEDPARLAGLAERMPPAPELDEFPGIDEAILSTAVVDLPEAEATPEIAESADNTPAEAQPQSQATLPAPPDEPAASPDEWVASADERTASGDGPAAEASAAEESAAEAAEAAADPDDAGVPEGNAADPRTGWLDHLDPDAAAAAEAEALVGLDRQTDLIVSGLSSVAGIAAFKAALVHVEGVSAVSVTAGRSGDVLFTVTHAGATDLRDAVQGMEAFQAQVIADEGDRLSLVAREPAA